MTPRLAAQVLSIYLRAVFSGSSGFANNCHHFDQYNEVERLERIPAPFNGPGGAGAVATLCGESAGGISNDVALDAAASCGNISF